MESALEAMRRAGATTVDVRYPRWLLDGKDEFYNAVRWPEFAVADCPVPRRRPGRTTRRRLDDLIARARQFTSTATDGGVPEHDTLGAVRQGSRPAARSTIRIPGGARPRAAGGADGGRRDSGRAQARRNRLSDGVAPAGAPRRAARSAQHALGHQHREPDRLPRSDRAGRLHERAPCQWESRSSDRRSANRSCWRSATRSSRLTKARRLPRLTPALAGDGITVP